MQTGAPRAVLIDVWETLVSCDFDLHNQRRAADLGIDPTTMKQHMNDLRLALTIGDLRLSDAFEAAASIAGHRPGSAAIHAIVARDFDELRQSTSLFDDSVSFLATLRAEGIRSALVSNCADNTRPLLVAMGLVQLVDACVLSNEVRTAKPSETIYRLALERLGVAAEQALFIDDQAPYCHGAASIGIRAVQIVRRPAEAESASDCVASLAAALSLIV